MTVLGATGWGKGEIMDKKKYEDPELKATLCKDILKASEEQGGGVPVSPIQNGGEITFQ